MRDGGGPSSVAYLSSGVRECIPVCRCRTIAIVCNCCTKSTRPRSHENERKNASKRCVFNYSQNGALNSGRESGLKSGEIAFSIAKCGVMIPTCHYYYF